MSNAHQDKVNFIWSVKEVLRDHYKRHQYQDVILPFCVLRRLDCVLEPTKDQVLAKAAELGADRLDGAADLLAHGAGQSFYNTSLFSFASLLDDAHNITENTLAFVRGFSPNVRDALLRFGLPGQIEKMGEAEILYMVVKRFAEIDLHPNVVSNIEMGYIYEELIRVTADLSNEEAGEHFTPREVIELMVNLLFANDARLLTPGRVATVYDPACGTGGMLSVAEEHLRTINPKARLHVFGQEIQPESYAVCRTDMLIKGGNADNIVFGDSLKPDTDGFPNRKFDYCLANPPFGKDWKTIADVVRKEHLNLGMAGRFGAGLPDTDDGQILFLQQMISKLKPVEEGGGRIAVVFNGSPLFSDGPIGEKPKGRTGNLCSIRQWIIENDWLDAVIGLPDQLFYNTGIFTYVWIVTNNKAPERVGHVQLIDARELFAKMPKSLGNKRNLLTDTHIREITAAYESFANTERSKILPNAAFGYRRVVVERPLRVRYQVTDAALEGLANSAPVLKLEAEADVFVDAMRSVTGIYESQEDFEKALLPVWAKLTKVLAPLRKAVIDSCMVRARDADPVRVKGDLVPDPELRDTELIPLLDDVNDFVEREVLPFAPDAWVDDDRTRIGYEIPFTRHFYEYQPPRDLAEIDAEIRASEARIQALLAEVTE